MLQIANLQDYSEANIGVLCEMVTPILSKRKILRDLYTRYGDETKVMYKGNGISIPYEKFLTDLATGYLSGTPNYKVDVSKDEEKNKLLDELFGKSYLDTDYVRKQEIIIEYITKYNDDAQANHDYIHDVLELTSAYELIYENSDNEIVYSRLDPLQTVATWDYGVPANLTGLVRIWREKTLGGSEIEKVELIDKNTIRRYTRFGENFESCVCDEIEEHYWGDVPGFAVETPFSIFEPCEDIINAVESLLQNIKNTYQYNDQDCKLKIVGYRPENPLTEIDDKGNVVPNRARAIEDQTILNSKTFYIEDGNGDVSYITKPIDSNGAIDMFKMYVDLMFQLSGIPNTSDLAFDGTDLNASAIDRKFYIMNMTTEKTISMLEKAYLRRWELIFNHINLKKSTNFDFRDIVVEIPKDLPSNQSEMADYYLKLKDMISSQTIVESLGFNYLSEKEKMEKENADNIQANLETIKALGTSKTEVTEDDVATIYSNDEEVEEETKVETDDQSRDTKTKMEENG